MRHPVQAAASRPLIDRLGAQPLPEEAYPVPDEYAVVVIGAGPSGESAADRAVRDGLTVAIVESELAGGECSYPTMSEVWLRLLEAYGL